MEKHHRRALNRCMNDLIENLDPSVVMPYLVQEELMSSDDTERISNQMNTREKAVFLFVPLLQRKGPNAFEQFVRALQQEHCYIHLANKLRDEAKRVFRQQSEDKGDDCSLFMKYHKTALLKNMVEIKDNLDVDDVMSHMITKEIMTHNDREVIEKRTTRAERVEKFLSILPTRGGDAFHVFVEALDKYTFHRGLSQKLKEESNSLKDSYEECLNAELLNEAKPHDSHDFNVLKESVANCLGRRDALDLCKHLELDDNIVKHSKHPSLTVVSLLCEKGILLQDKIHNFERISEVFPQDVKSLVLAYNAQRKEGVEIPIIVEVRFYPSHTEKDEDLIRSKLKDKLWTFSTGKRLRKLFQRFHGIKFKRLEEGSIILQLTVPTIKALLMLHSKIENGTLAQELLPELFPKEDVDITDYKWSELTLEVILEQKYYSKAMEELLKLEKEKPKENNFDDSDYGVFNSFSEKIGIWRNVNLGDIPAESNTSTPCNAFLNDVPRMCRFPGFSDEMTGERYNMRDFIYTILKHSQTSIRGDIIAEIKSSNMAVPLLLSGTSESGPEFLQWVPSINEKFEKEEEERFFSKFVVSVVRIGETRISKSSLLNTLFQLTQKKAVPSPFLIKDITFPRPSFSQGCVEVVTSPSPDTDSFPHGINFLNLRGDCTDFEAQTKFLIRFSDLIVAFVNETSVPEQKRAIDEIKNQGQNVLIVEVKEHDSFPAHERNCRLSRRQESILVDVLQMDVLCDEIHKEIIQKAKEYKANGKLKHDVVSRFCTDVGITVKPGLREHHTSKKNQQVWQSVDMYQQEEQECNILIKNSSRNELTHSLNNEKSDWDNDQVEDMHSPGKDFLNMPRQKIYAIYLIKMLLDYCKKDLNEQTVSWEDFGRVMGEEMKCYSSRLNTILFHVLSEITKAIEEIDQQ